MARQQQLYRDRVQVSVDERGVAQVTLQRPDKYNALDLDMLHALIEAATALGKSRTLRAVILTGAGPSFCAGLDFARVLKTPGRILRAFLPFCRDANTFQRCCWAWRQLPVPVIVVTRGHCFGGGLQIALGGDFRFSAPDGQFSVMEVKWGLIPDMSGSLTLRELLPMDQAKLLTMTGRVLSAEQARTLGLITDVAEDPMAAAETLVEELLTRSPDALAATKALFHAAWGAPDDVALASERRIQARLLMGQNQRRSMKAALERKAPSFLPRRFR